MDPATQRRVRNTREKTMANFGIGIDTGGTYTDTVLYDFEKKTVVSKAKALTTKEDLAVGISAALDLLQIPPGIEPGFISLSTTLATNACVENRLGHAKLVFFGGDRRNLDRYAADFGLPPTDEIVLVPCVSSYSEGQVESVDWDCFERRLQTDLKGLDGVGIIELYSMRNGAVVEKEAKQRLEEQTGIPAVCGYELVTELNCLQRGASTLVNAALVPTIRRFLLAIKGSLAGRGLARPVVIVRSDGNLMSEDYATLRPAETLLSGPAASVVGGLELAREKDCLIVDMGGTTSDIALVRSGVPLGAASGISIGKWKTGIKGLYIRTFGLGADSAVHFDHDGPRLEEYRVTPWCMAAAKHPALKEDLRRLTLLYPRHTRFVHEGFMFARDISANPRYSAFEKRFSEALRSGPLLLPAAAAAVGRDEYSLDVSRLIADEVVHVFGLTPTDIMHLRGEFTRYDAEGSALAAEFVANCLGLSTSELADWIYREVCRKLYLNIVATLLEHENPAWEKQGLTEKAAELALDFYRRRTGKTGKGFLRADFATDLPLVGVGAPIHVFLAEVAAMLGTRAIIGPHAEVANALGAVVGKVHAERSLEIRADYNTEGINGYTVFADQGNVSFKEREEAEAWALCEAESAARVEVVRRGATGEVLVNCRLESREGMSRNGALHLGSRAIAYAVGSAGGGVRN